MRLRALSEFVLVQLRIVKCMSTLSVRYPPSRGRGPVRSKNLAIPLLRTKHDQLSLLRVTTRLSGSALRSKHIRVSAKRTPLPLLMNCVICGLHESAVSTASHGLCHCGMDHCVYYALGKQSTASLAEDVRQPPYLCPVALAKFPRSCGSQRDTHMFAALGVWVKTRFGDLDRLEG